MGTRKTVIPTQCELEENGIVLPKERVSVVCGVGAHERKGEREKGGIDSGEETGLRRISSLTTNIER